MTLEEKQKFLDDRFKDEKEFYVGDKLVRFEKGKLIILTDIFYLDIVNLNKLSLRLKPAWEFTEDEKVILRNLKGRRRWISRNADGILVLHDEKPRKKNKAWVSSLHYCLSFNCFNHLFQSVQWEDDEPCEFREFM